MMRFALALVTTLLADVSSLIISAPRPVTIAFASGRNSFAPVMDAEAKDALDQKQIAALDAAMRSLDQCGEMMDPFKPRAPRTLFSVLRTPSATPTAEEWDALRMTVLDLADCSDEALLAALLPLKELKVDMRSLPKGRPFSGGRFYAPDKEEVLPPPTAAAPPPPAATTLPAPPAPPPTPPAATPQPAPTTPPAPPPPPPAPPPPPLVNDPLTADQVAALDAASRTQDVCGKLVSTFGQPLGLFSVLRRPSEDPSPEEWAEVRRTVLELADCSDAALLAALAPLKEQYVDIRTLDRGRKFEGRYYGGVAEAEARKSKEAAGETGGFDVGSFFSGFGKKKK